MEYHVDTGHIGLCAILLCDKASHSKKVRFLKEITWQQVEVFPRAVYNTLLSSKLFKTMKTKAWQLTYFRITLRAQL